jgi:pilus assembly protein CpaE
MSTVESEIRIGVAGVCLDAVTNRAISHFLGAIPSSSIVGSLDFYHGADREVPRLLQRADTRICIIDYDRNHDEALAFTERLRCDSPDVSSFAISSQMEPNQIISAMRAGCSEYLVKPLDNERLFEAVTRVETKQKERVRSKTRGMVISLVGAKGGTGVTSLAMHLALELSNGGQNKCVLVDQHPALGDASLYLGTGRHQYCFYELASNTDRLDEELLRGFLLHHDSGLDLVDAPDGVGAIHSAPPSAVEQTVAFLAEQYAYVVIDCPPGLTDLTLACIAQSDKVGIVMTAELPAVRNTVRYLQHLNKLGYEKNVQVVLNRYSKRGPLSDERIEKTLQRGISVHIANDYQEVIRAINAGAPITSQHKSEFGMGIRGWARDVAASKKPVAAKAAAATPSSGGVLRLFRK